VHQPHHLHRAQSKLQPTNQLGPFIDSSHPLVKVGDLDETPTEIFRNQVASRLSTFTEDCPATAVIVIPSVRDMVSRHVAFPQAMLEKSPELGLPKVRSRPLLENL
jgi:DNA polymerase alpha subunit B